MIDHFAGAENVFRLERGGGVGDIDLVVDVEFVAGAGGNTQNLGGEPAVVAARHRVRLLQHHVNALCRWRPQPELRTAICQPGTERTCAHATPAKASTERGGALVSSLITDSTFTDH